MKITISGVVGAGKTTLSHTLEEEFGLEYKSVGKIMRKMARERNISFDELTQIAKKDSSVDEELDKKQKEMNKEDGFVMDSRLGFHFIPDSIKIYLKVDIKEAARRIFAMNREDQHYESFEDCLGACKKRVEAEKIRYKKYYDIEFGKESDFDLLIDTTGKSSEIVALEAISFINSLREN
jgi:cytidylate kinase